MNGKIREIIIIAVILGIAVALSIPGYFEDKRAYEAYREQQRDSDREWKTSAPEAQGMDPERLEKLNRAVERTDACSLLIVRHGSLVFEKYYNGSSQDEYNNVYSVTKSVTSALIGIAVDKKQIRGIDQKITDYLGEFFHFGIHPMKKEITLRHLLTMTPGFCENNVQDLYTSQNWMEYAIQLPQKNKPGEKFEYANTASHMLAVILAKATGKSAEAYAEEYLFGPLDIKKKRWMADPQGNSVGNANLYLRPRDMAKFGLLYLNRGNWNGRQIVPEDWIKESVKKQVSTEEGQKNDPQNGYGYQWWTGRDGTHPSYSAVGYGGQYIHIVPDLDLVVVITSRPDSTLTVNDGDKKAFMEEYIIPAIKY